MVQSREVDRVLRGCGALACSCLCGGRPSGAGQILVVRLLVWTCRRGDPPRCVAAGGGSQLAGLDSRVPDAKRCQMRGSVL